MHLLWIRHSEIHATFFDISFINTFAFADNRAINLHRFVLYLQTIYLLNLFWLSFFLYNLPSFKYLLFFFFLYPTALASPRLFSVKLNLTFTTAQELRWNYSFWSLKMFRTVFPSNSSCNFIFQLHVKDKTCSKTNSFWSSNAKNEEDYCNNLQKKFYRTGCFKLKIVLILYWKRSRSCVLISWRFVAYSVIDCYVKKALSVKRNNGRTH